jgi:hypothetical protein
VVDVQKELRYRVLIILRIISSVRDEVDYDEFLLAAVAGDAD